MTLRVEGRWEDNARFGRRFKGERFTEVVPATREGLARYLSSGFAHGIGDKLAKRVVDAFGPQTIEVILADPARLGEVQGLGKERAPALQEAFRERRAGTPTGSPRTYTASASSRPTRSRAGCRSPPADVVPKTHSMARLCAERCRKIPVIAQMDGASAG